VPLLDNVGKRRTGQTKDDNIMRSMRIACWITEATDTHLEYVRLIAFPRHQWLRKRALILRCAYVVLRAIIRKKLWVFHNTISRIVFVIVTRLVCCGVLANVCLVTYLDQMNTCFNFLNFIFGLYVDNNTKPYGVRCITIGQTLRWTRMTDLSDVSS